MYSKTKAAIQALIQNQVIPGAQVAFMQADHVTTYCWGAAQTYPKRQPLYPNQLYDLASLTKVIGTTTLILQLVEQGRLQLTDPVQRYLPAVQDARIQIWHLLTHTANFTGYIPHRNELPADQLKTALLGLTFGDQVGKVVKYSDIGLIYCGWIIESFYHQPIQTVIQKRVLQPLGMAQSTFQPDSALCVPTAYEPQGRGLLQGVVHDPKAFILKEHCGSAGLFAPLSDLIQFGHFMLGDLKTAQPLLQRSTIEQLPQDATQCQGERGIGWDLIAAQTPDQHWLLYHTGYVGHVMLFDLQQHTGFIFLSNRIHPTAPNEAFIPLRDQLVATYLTENAK